MCPDLKDPLREHLVNFTEAQRAHIPSTIQEIIMKSFSSPVPTPVSSGVLPMQSDVLIPEEMPSTSLTAAQLEPLPPGME